MPRNTRKRLFSIFKKPLQNLNIRSIVILSEAKNLALLTS
jgi:hypothetical protein